MHLIAVLLTLFPGFGLGHVVLGRFRQAVIFSLIGLALSSFHVIAGQLAKPPIVTTRSFLDPPSFPWEITLITPLLIWNIYCAHRLWMEDSAVSNAETSEPTSGFFALGPIMFIFLLALAVLLVFQSWSTVFPTEPKGLTDIRYEQAEAKLDNHDLSFISKDIWSSIYKVDPGGYTLTVRAFDRHSYVDVQHSARVQRDSTEHFVYAQGFEVYVLDTQREDVIARFVEDLIEHQTANCVSGEDVGICGEVR